MTSCNGERPFAQQRDLCHELIRAGYYPRWDPPRQQYFDDAWTKVTLEYDYFLFFTTRYPTGIAGDNPVNTAYKYLILSHIPDDYASADRKATNLLATTLHRLLSQSTATTEIKGFYYPNNQYDNADTKKKLEDACDRSMVFVQLVQTIMFRPPDGGATNYCFFEWDRVDRRLSAPEHQTHMLYIVAATDRSSFSKLRVPTDYGAWHTHIRGKDAPYLPEAQFQDDKAVKDIQTTLKEKIVDNIEGAWFHLIDDVP